jgi:hypothetical protein
VATNRKLRAALLQKRNFSPQRLSQLVKRRKDELPMSTEHATYTIAHESGIDISKFLAADEVATVRDLIAQLRVGGRATRAESNGGARSKPARRKPALITIGGVDVTKVPGLSATHAAEAKQMAEKVFPMLYVFENSVRDLIAGVLEARYGKGWWDTEVPSRVREKAAERAKSEKKEPWHGRRGASPIHYVDLGDLWKIMNHRWNDFAHLFPSKAWIESLITSDMNVSRGPVAHMNPLAPEDVKNVEAAFSKWARQMKAKASELP